MCKQVEFGFDCVCAWVREHPGSLEFSCEFCGLYTAGAPRCNRCECTNEDIDRLTVTPDGEKLLEELFGGES